MNFKISLLGLKFLFADPYICIYMCRSRFFGPVVCFVIVNLLICNIFLKYEKESVCTPKELQPHAPPSFASINLQKFTGQSHSEQAECMMDVDIDSRKEAFKQISSRELGPQHGEDSFVLEQFFLGLTQGMFLEMGALDGLLFSNTLS